MSSPARHTGQNPIPGFDDLETGPNVAGMSRWQITMALRTGKLTIDDPFSAAPDDIDGLLGSWLVNPRHSKTYDPARIYGRATNRHDHSHVVKMRVDQDAWIAVESLVAKVPAFGSAQAFVRDAIIHSLNVWRERLGEMDGQWSNMVSLVTLRAAQEIQQEEITSRKRFIDDAEMLMASIADAGDTDAMLEALDFHQAVADALPEPWRGRMEKVIGKWREWYGRETKQAG